jgi:hypothetical protein
MEQSFCVLINPKRGRWMPDPNHFDFAQTGDTTAGPRGASFPTRSTSERETQGLMARTSTITPWMWHGFTIKIHVGSHFSHMGNHFNQKKIMLRCLEIGLNFRHDSFMKPSVFFTDMVICKRSPPYHCEVSHTRWTFMVLSGNITWYFTIVGVIKCYKPTNITIFAKVPAKNCSKRCCSHGIAWISPSSGNENRIL